MFRIDKRQTIFRDKSSNIIRVTADTQMIRHFFRYFLFLSLYSYPIISQLGKRPVNVYV